MDGQGHEGMTGNYFGELIIMGSFIIFYLLDIGAEMGRLGLPFPGDLGAGGVGRGPEGRRCLLLLLWA